MSDREAILGAIPPSQGAVSPPPAAPRPAGGELWPEFERKLVALGGRLACPSDLDRLPAPVWVEDAARGMWPEAPLGVEEIWDAEAGVAVADLAVAETGSVLIAAGPGRRRMASLAPPLSVILVPERAIVATLDEAFAALADRTSVLVTGTSRTGDIEGILVRGVHGPRELWIVPITPPV